MDIEDFNRPNLLLHSGISKMERDLTESDRRWYAREKDPYDEAHERAWGDRMPGNNEYNERSDALLNAGIKVRTSVRWSHMDHPPSLMIYVDDLPEHEQPEAWVNDRTAPDRFKARHSRWTSDRTTHPAIHRHITICTAEDLRSFEDWRFKLHYIYAKFDDKVLWLWPDNITSGSTLELDPQRDPIASDIVVQELHSKTLKYNRQEDGSYTTRVPPLHISM